MDQSPPPDSPTPPPDSMPPETPTGDLSAAANSPEKTAQDDLPAWEPLTPELLEDEAIRGDFVLRWAVVGLALLIGCTEILDARALVHVRSGEWLAAHGGLPSALDPFSIAAADRRWVNLSWGFDLISAGIYAVGGGIGLSIIKGLLAAIAIALMVHSIRPGIRTWWGSLCGALVLLVAYPLWEWQPELITFLGVAGLFWFFVTSESQSESSLRWWCVPVLFFVWGQLDPRAWIGLFLLLFYVLGQWFNRPAGEGDLGRTQLRWGRLAGMSVVALVLHPFLWQTLLAPVSQYTLEYPALRAAYPRPLPADRLWYPLWSAVVWQTVDHRLVAALLLMAAAGVSLLLNRTRASLSHWLCYLGVNALALVTTHELAVASVVNCVLATVHGQEWYRARFGQIYSLAWQDVLFSRGGRAITVAGFFGLAWVLISGRLDGPDGRRTGVGISRSLQQQIDDFRKLDSVVFDDHGFHFNLSQGDALIAAGRRSFVDHRAQLFAGQGEADLFAMHDRLRKSLRKASVAAPLPQAGGSWREIFDRYAISHALPRLTSDTLAPDYLTLMDLMSSTEWSMTELRPTVAVFHRSQSPSLELTQFAQQQRLNVIEQAFRTESATLLEPRDRPSPPVWSQTLLSLPRRTTGAGTQLARHWLTVLQAVPTSPMPFQIGLAVLAARAAEQGAFERPDTAESYLVLAEATAVWQRLEAAVLAERQIPWMQSSRYYQAVAAARQAAELAPQDARPEMLLIELYQTAGLADVTYDAIVGFLEKNQEFGLQNEAELAQREALVQMRGRLMQVIADTQQQVEEAFKEEADRLQVAMFCRQAGCLQLAIKTLQEDAVYVERNPYARLQLSVWLAERGDGLELDDSVAILAAVGPGLAASAWHEPVAYAALGRGDFLAARDAWKDATDELDRSRLQSLLMTSPVSHSSTVWLGDSQYPLSHLIAVQDAVSRQVGQSTVWDFSRSLAALEQGDLTGTRDAMQAAIARFPESPLRPLLRLYWFCLTDELLDEEPPSDWIPAESLIITPE